MKRSDKFLTSSAIALCGLLLGSTGAFAAESAKPHKARGTITGLDLGQHRLVLSDRKDNSAHRFQWNDQTRFTDHGKSVAVTMLKLGEAVRLTYLPGGDVPIAQRVRIAPAKGEKHAAKRPSHGNIPGAKAQPTPLRGEGSKPPGSTSNAARDTRSSP